MSNCCATHNTDEHNHHTHAKTDYVMTISVALIAAILFGYVLFPQINWLHTAAYTVIELFHTMWWGIALGIASIALLSKVPREYFTIILGKKDNLGGIMRATIAGLVLDLCNHGIIMVGAKLYERGVSLAKVMALLIASPWNSLSLTFILITLIGLKWTLIYVALSAVIALVTGLIYGVLVQNKTLPSNPNKTETPDGFSIKEDAKARLKHFKPDLSFFKTTLKDSIHEGQMLIRWLLLSVVLTAAIRAFVPPEMFTSLFGPTFLGLLATLGVTTILEICSEGSAPIAAEILNRAKAPGNGFAFLMAGVATDYTEMMVIREFSKSWKVTLSLPLITVPQILVLGYIMNMAGL